MLISIAWREASETVKPLLSLLAMSNLWLGTSPVLAARQFNFYWPNDHFCAVYRGTINSEKQFSVLINEVKKITIEANKEFHVAVTRHGKILPAYQVDSSTNSTLVEHFYRTSTMGEHVIRVRGTAPETTVTVCIR